MPGATGAGERRAGAARPGGVRRAEERCRPSRQTGGCCCFEARQRCSKVILRTFGFEVERNSLPHMKPSVRFPAWGIKVTELFFLGNKGDGTVAQ